jgi:hypothetical protein
LLADEIIRLFERGKSLLRGGEALVLPSPAGEILFICDGSGWRGARGEVEIKERHKRNQRTSD